MNRRASYPHWLLSPPALAVLCLGMLSLGVATRGQFERADKMRRDNDDIERKIILAKHDNQELRKASAALQTPAGMEREARRLGWVKKGEIRMLIPAK